MKRNELSSHEKTWWKLNAHCWEKETHLKRLYAVWFQLYDILEKAQPRSHTKLSCCQGFRGREGEIGKIQGILKIYFCYLAALGLSCDTRDLVPWPGIEPGPHALGVWSPSHWDHRGFFFFNWNMLIYSVSFRCAAKEIYIHIFFSDSLPFRLLQDIQGLPRWLSDKGSNC